MTDPDPTDPDPTFPVTVAPAPATEAFGPAPEAFDVVVVGAGPAGATAALALAVGGLTVALVGPVAAVDARTTALLGGSVDLLARLDVWPRAVEAAAPLKVMRLVDATRRLIRAPETAFDAAELGREAFGWNIPNDALNKALAEVLAMMPRVARIAAPASHIAPDATGVTVVAGGRALRGRLAVAADGAHSPTREAAGLAVRRWRYRQTALVTTLRHTVPHFGVSTEFHTPSGPFTLVPLPGQRSSLVWIERPAEAERLAALDDAALAAAIEAQAQSILGAMTIDGPRGLLPLDGHLAVRFGGNRVALVGEAAHRFPPIGAQGLNLGLRDVADLARAVRRSPADPGAAPVLADYDGARRRDAAPRTAAVDLLDRSLLTGFLPVQFARSVGLWAAGRIPPLRRLAMRAGLGTMADDTSGRRAAASAGRASR